MRQRRQGSGHTTAHLLTCPLTKGGNSSGLTVISIFAARGKRKFHSSHGHASKLWSFGTCSEQNKIEASIFFFVLIKVSRSPEEMLFLWVFAEIFTMGVTHKVFELTEDFSLLNAVNSWEIHLRSWDFYRIEFAWKKFCFQTFRSNFYTNSSV